MRQEQADIDLNFIKALPGRKIFVKGNHDLWWEKTKKLNDTYCDNMYFIQNNSYSYEDIAIVGTRGWNCPNDIEYTQQDMKIYKREQQRLRVSIEDAIKNGFKRLMVVLHYPPTNDQHERSAFIEIIEAYPVEKVVYGHLHGTQAYDAGLKGVCNGVEYLLTSCDYLDFKPSKII
jgi:predicted phosphohydrolase